MYYKEDTTQVINRDFTGRSFYISINLRRFLNSNNIANTPVLKIKVPYVFWKDTTYLKLININGRDTLVLFSEKITAKRYAEFDSIPSASSNNYFALSNNYGKIWKLDSAVHSNKPTEMIITRQMLPLNNEDITISGYLNFQNYDLSSGTGNHKLKSHPAENGTINMIDSLKIEVTYLDTMQIAIDWVRFESPNARKIFQGVYDNELAQSVQDDITFFTQPKYRNNNVKPMRWTVNVEGNPINWGAERHFRKLVGDVVTGETAAALPDHYDEFINPADKWYGQFGITSYVAAPYCESNKAPNTKVTVGGITYTNSNLWKTMNLKQGNKYHPLKNSSNNLFDRYNSEYETYLRDTNSSSTVEYVRNMPIQDYIKDSRFVNYSQGEVSLQTYWEWALYCNYVNPYMSRFVYSDIPWYSQSFVQHILPFDSIRISNGNIYGSVLVHSSFGRHATAEEVSLMSWNPLIMGAKGLIFDGDFDYGFGGGSSGQIRLFPAKDVLKSRFSISYDSLYNMNDSIYLNSPHLTGDYLNSSYNHIPIRSKIYTPASSLDTVSRRMGNINNLGVVDTNRIYIGAKSKRKQIALINTFAKENSDELMRLKLLTWYGKGYKVWENHHPDIDTNFISTILNKDKLRSRKLFNVNSGGYTVNLDTGNTYEDFFDITILKDIYRSTDSLVYIGLQNRRIDPLIYFDTSTTFKHFLFLSKSEFEDLCRFGGEDPLSQKCLEIKFKNNSDCNYSLINFIIKFKGISNFNNTSSYGFDTNKVTKGSYTYLNLNGSLGANSQKSITICFNNNTPSFEYQIFAGQYLKGKLINCDEPLTEIENVSNCLDCNLINVQLVSRNDSCHCFCNFKIVGSILPGFKDCVNNYSVQIISGNDTINTFNNLAINQGVLAPKNLCIGGSTYKLKVNIYLDSNIVCTKYMESSPYTCSVCDSINVHHERLITEGGVNYKPNTYRFNIDLKNLQNCVSEVKRYFVNEDDQAFWVETKPFLTNQTISWQTMIHVSKQKFIFLNSLGDTICSKIINVEDLTCGGFPANNTDIINVGDIDNIGSMCCMPVVLKDVSLSYNEFILL